MKISIFECTYHILWGSFVGNMSIKIWLVVLNLSTDGKTVKPNSTNMWSRQRQSAFLQLRLWTSWCPLGECSRSSRCQIIQMSEHMFGRDNFFEQYSKLLIVVYRCATVAQRPFRRWQGGPVSISKDGRMIPKAHQRSSRHRDQNLRHIYL
jgi:hypothetical protein